MAGLTANLALRPEWDAPEVALAAAQAAPWIRALVERDFCPSCRSTDRKLEIEFRAKPETDSMAILHADGRVCLIGSIERWRP